MTRMRPHAEAAGPGPALGQHLRRYGAGERAVQRHAEDRTFAVVRGRVRLEFLGARAGEAPLCLRASDAAAIPADALYQVEALEASTVFLAPESPAAAPLIPWGV